MTHGRFTHETGAVRHHLPERDLAAEGVRGVEVGEVAGDRNVEVDLPLLHELHDRDVGEELGDAPHAIDGLRGGAHAVVGMREAEALRPYDLLVVHQRDRDGGKVLAPHLVLDEGRELRGHRLVAGGRRGALRTRGRRRRHDDCEGGQR